MNIKLGISIMGLGLAAAFAVACGDDTGTANNTQNPFTPASSSGGAPDGGPAASSSGGSSSGDATCGKPAGCFCGTPTTQAQFLNRCTTAAALPVTLAVKAAAVPDLP